MNRSPIFHKDEEGGCNEPGHDPETEFFKFLEEAKMYANDAALSQSHIISSVWKGDRERTTKNKKSWRRAMSSFWFKLHKKKKKKKKENGAEKEATKPESGCSCGNTTAEQRVVSGPLIGNGKSLAALHQKFRTSDPLSGCFTPTRAVELEVPYMHLNEHNLPVGGMTFGPIYLVT